jgi:hypothetical protein
VSEDAVEAVHGRFGQPVPGTEQQHAVGPGQVVLAAPMALGLLRDALRTLVTITFASRTRCQWSTLIRAAGRAVSRADRNVAEGSIATTSIRSRQAGVRASCGPHAGTTPRFPP